MILNPYLPIPSAFRRTVASWPGVGEAVFKDFIGAEADLIRNIHGIAKVAELEGDEGLLLGRVAAIMSQPRIRSQSH